MKKFGNLTVVDFKVSDFVKHHTAGKKSTDVLNLRQNPSKANDLFTPIVRVNVTCPYCRGHFEGEHVETPFLLLK